MTVLGLGGGVSSMLLRNMCILLHTHDTTSTQLESKIVWFTPLCVLNNQWLFIGDGLNSLPTSHMHHWWFHSRKALVHTFALFQVDAGRINCATSPSVWFHSLLSIDITEAGPPTASASPHTIPFILGCDYEWDILLVFRLSGTEQLIPENEVGMEMGGGIIIFSFVLFMLKQSWGIFIAELCCFRAMSIFQLESLINLYLHKQTLPRLFEDIQGKRVFLALTLSTSPNASYKSAERDRSSQVWR